MKIDLHVHSKYSKRPSQWILQKINCPESFTDPHQVYRIARKRGMSLVTLTDHNTIDGALEIAHLPDVFISEEITSYFPEDGCKIHVLALNITEKDHREFQKIRKNVFDLVAYLNRERIVYIMAHPLYAVNDRLTIEHFEQMLLLFRNFELNGARNDRQNQTLSYVLTHLKPGDIDELADKYEYYPLFTNPWRKNLTGGSDDHSGLNIARTYTRIIGATGIDSALRGIENRKAEVVSQASSPMTMAHNLYGIAYQFYRSRFKLDRHVNKDRLLGFLDHSLQPEGRPEGGVMSRIYSFLSYRKNRSRKGVPDSMMALIRQETNRLLEENPQLMNMAEDANGSFEERERSWFDFVNQLSSKVLFYTGDHLLGHLSGANVFNIFQTIGSAGGLYTLLAPYFVAFSQFTKDYEMNSAVLKRFTGDAYEEAKKMQRVKVAHFTDTFYDVNGVAQTLQQQVEAARKNHKQLTIITCDTEAHPRAEGVKNFKPIGVYEIPEYEDQKVYYPPFLEMLNYCYEQRFTHIHSATPGPIGLAALAIAHFLKLPITGTYHTAFPQYAQYLTGDNFIEELTWKFMIWYYDQMNCIYVSSYSSADELTEKGIRLDKIKLIPRGIDTAAFHPSKRNGLLKKKYQVTQEAVALLYVGRVSKEKNLHLLADAFQKLVQIEKQVHLVVVGDGPYLEEMKKELAGCPVVFTGYLKGEELSTVYASGDIFVFPSTTDTFGNVVLEAQSSGLPVIVSDMGGPCENMLPYETGLMVKGDDETELLEAMQSLVSQSGLRKNMGKAARQYMEERSFENAFIQSWELYKEMDRPAHVQFAKAG